MSRTTVVLVNYKGAHDTRMCLRSLYSSQNRPRIVVVDNTPQDKELLDVMHEFPDAHLITAEENLGFGQGNNLGIEWAISDPECQFIFILNNDATVAPDSINRLEAVLDSSDDIGIVTPRVVLMEQPNVLWYGGGEVSWIRGSAKQPGILGSSEAPLALTARTVTFASGCAILVRRDLMNKLKGFDKNFFMYEEDLELCLRTLKLGWKIWYEPRALVLHRVQASSRGNQGYVSMLSPKNENLPFYVFHSVRNRLINMKLHATGWRKCAFIFGFSLFLTKKTGQFILHRRWDGTLSIIRAIRSYQTYLQFINKEKDGKSGSKDAVNYL